MPFPISLFRYIDLSTNWKHLTACMVNRIKTMLEKAALNTSEHNTISEHCNRSYF